MASKLIVFVVFAAVVQTSLAATAAQIAAANQRTHESWSATVDTIYSIIGNASLDINTARIQYGAAAKPGRQAFLSVAKEGNNQTLLAQLSQYSKEVGDRLFASITAARNAKAKNYGTTIATINNNRQKLPLAAAVHGDFALAGSTASTAQALAAVSSAWDNFYVAVRSLADFRAGKRSLDLSSKGAAYIGLSQYIDYIYAQVLSNQG